MELLLSEERVFFGELDGCVMATSCLVARYESETFCHVVRYESETFCCGVIR